jgi:hypothetical protein
MLWNVIKSKYPAAAKGYRQVRSFRLVIESLL